MLIFGTVAAGTTTSLIKSLAALTLYELVLLLLGVYAYVHVYVYKLHICAIYWFTGTLQQEISDGIKSSELSSLA